MARLSIAAELGGLMSGRWLHSAKRKNFERVLDAHFDETARISSLIAGMDVQAMRIAGARLRAICNQPRAASAAVRRAF